MPTTLSVHATERSTYIITASFTDEDGDPVTPNAPLTWTLTDRDGNVINSRSAVTIAPDTSVDIVLTNNDLAIGTGASSRMYVLLIEGTYDSTLGSGLSLRDEARFTIDNLVKVT